MHRVLGVLLGMLALTAPVARAQHTGDMLVGSTTSGGGALAIDFDFGDRILVTPSFVGPTQTLYTTTDPGWDAIVAAGGGFIPLVAGTPVTVEITAIDPGVSLKVGPTTLDAPGESRLLGNAPAIHVHPSWQLVLDNGVVAERSVAFRMTTTAAGYSASVAYTAMLSNAPPTTTTSSTSSTAPMATTTTTLPGADEAVSGKKLMLKDKPGAPAKRAFLAQSNDPALSIGAGNGSPGDPTLAGATLRLRGTTFDEVYDLPATGWKRLGKAGQQKGYKYADKALAAGPIKAAILKPGKQLKVMGKGAALGFTLGVDPSPVEVVLAIGTRRYCLAFGGEVAFVPGKQLKAHDALASAGCP